MMIGVCLAVLAAAVPAGRISGHVRLAGDDPAIMVVEAAVRPPHPGWTGEVFRAVPGVDGSYCLDVPAGRYCVQIRSVDSASRYAVSRPNHGDAPAETLLVDSDHSPVVDFELGRMHVHLDLPPVMDGTRWSLLLYRRSSPRTPVRSEHGPPEIRGGTLDLTAPALYPGDYRMRMVVGGDSCDCSGCWCAGETFWLPGTRDSSAALWVEIAPNATADISCAVGVERPARLEGDVTGAWLEMGLSLPPSVTLVTPDSLPVLGPWGVAPDGHFAVDLFLPEPVKVRVDHYGIAQWVGGPDFAEAEVFPLESGRTTTGARLVQSGLRVVLGGPWLEVQDACIRLYDPTDLRLLASSDLLSGKGLVHGLPNLRPGTYLILLTRAAWWYGSVAWAPQWFDRAVHPRDATAVTIGREGEVANLDVTCDPGGTIRGTVSATQLMGGVVRFHYFAYLTPADDPSCLGRVMTTSRPLRYEMAGVPNGRWKVGVARYEWDLFEDPPVPAQPPAGTVWYPSATDWNEAGIVSVSDLRTVEGIDFVLP
jgi:hypothetical protein